WTNLEKRVLSFFSFSGFCVGRWGPRADISARGPFRAGPRLRPWGGVGVLGDPPADIHAARVAGLPIIVLATGIYTFPDLLTYGPDACFASASDLLALIAESTAIRP